MIEINVDGQEDSSQVNYGRLSRAPILYIHWNASQVGLRQMSQLSRMRQILGLCRFCLVFAGLMQILDSVVPSELEPYKIDSIGCIRNDKCNNI